MNNFNNIYVHIFLLVLAVMGCHKDDPYLDNTPPTPTTDLKGSFENIFTRYKKGQTYNGRVISQWTDTVWKNDRVYKQLILWSDAVITGLSYEISELVNASNIIAKTQTRLRFVNYAYGDATAQTCGNAGSRTNTQIADILSETPITSLASDDPLRMWLTIDVPANTLPGNYAGTIKIKSGNSILKTFDVDLFVTNKTLPDVANWSFHLDLWQFPFQYATLCSDSQGKKIVPFTDTFYSLIEPFYKMLADGGQTAITTYIKDGAFMKGQSMVKWTKNGDGTWSFDFTNFNTYVSKMMSWGITKQIDAFSLIGWNTSIGYFDAASGTSKTIPLDVTDTDYATIWSSFLTAFKSNLDANGWFDKTVLYMDEIPDSKMQSVISVIKSNNPDWKIGLAGSYCNASTENALYDYSTIFGYTRKSVNTITTFYTSCSQQFPNNYLTLQNSPAEMAFMAWYAAAKGFKGYLRWAYDYWTLSDPTDIRDGSNASGDYNMVYRTDNTSTAKAISSIRFELLRLGIQDFEKIKILNDPELASYLALFTNSSSSNNALELVGRGQSLIKKISVKY